MENATFDKLHRLKNRIAKIAFHRHDGLRTRWRLEHARTPRVYLFGHPIHPNVGDQAQAVCIRRWIARHYPDHELICLNWTTATDAIIRKIAGIATADDRIFCHSGYLMTDHHRELPVFRRVAAHFRNHRVVILPQTIHFRDEKLLAEVADDFNGHPDLVLICRDHVSLELAKKWFHRCRLAAFPDFVTTLIGTRAFKGERRGIFLCARTGREALYTRGQLGELAANLSEVDEVIWGDTNSRASYIHVNHQRDLVLDQVLASFARYRLVITDRYHGTIFALIASTPVVVLSSSDHKLESGVAWFPDSFRPYVRHAKDLDEACLLARELLGMTDREPLPRYFGEEYYDGFHEVLAKLPAPAGMPDAANTPSSRP